MTVAAAALVLHPDCGRHDTGWGHPEHQGRLPAIVNAIYQDTPDLLPHLLQHEAAPASEDALLRVHTAEHIARVRALVDQSAETGRPLLVSGDTAVSAASWDAALAAAGCAIDAARLVADGSARAGFALCRPPGHHAPADALMGFCLFNNVAVAARELQHAYDIRRVLIVDWDVHHGNGTQDIFEEDPSVYYLSLHQAPWYPGTGDARERGHGRGAGFTRNVPLPAGTARQAWLQAFRSALEATLAEFTPDFVLVSAGFDVLHGDPLGGQLLEPEDLHAATCLLRQHADGRLAFALEGGYTPARVGAGVVDVLRALCDLPPKAAL